MSKHYDGSCGCADRMLNECGCVAHVYSDGSGVDIFYCDTHRAAPDLLEALIDCRQMLENIQGRHLELPLGGYTVLDYSEYLDKADAALAKATGEEV